MAARINRTRLTDKWREKIKASMLLNALADHVFGKREMKASQIKAAEILLRKVMPDLSAVEQTLELTNYVIRAPQIIESADEWEQQYKLQ